MRAAISLALASVLALSIFGYVDASASQGVGKLEEMEQRISNVEDQVTTLNNTVVSMDERLNVLQSNLEDINHALSQVRTNVDHLWIKTRIKFVELPIAANGTRIITVKCNTDETLLGAGYYQASTQNRNFWISEFIERSNTDNIPANENYNAAYIRYNNDDSEPMILQVAALCGKITSEERPQ